MKISVCKNLIKTYSYIIFHVTTQVPLHPQYTHQPTLDDLFGFVDHVRNNFRGWLDRIDETGILAEHQRRVVGVSATARLGDGLRSLRAALAQRPFPARPASDKRIALQARQSAWPYVAGNKVVDMTFAPASCARLK